MAMIQMPENFNPEYTKFYKMFDQEFTIQVQYRGIDLDDKTQKTYHYWAFKLLVGDELIVAGPFRHETEGRELTLEAVANNLASFYGYNIEGLIERSREERRLQEALEVPDIDELAQKCANYALMNLSDAFVLGLGLSDYDVMLKHQDENGWDIVLMLHCEPRRLYHFSKLRQGKVSITTYARAHKVQIDKL